MSTTLILLLAAMTTACLINTLIDAAILQVPRRWLLQRSSPLVAYVLSCHYCASHWIAAPTVLLLAGDVQQAAILWLPTVWLAVHALAVFHVVNSVVPYWKAIANAHEQRHGGPQPPPAR